MKKSILFITLVLLAAAAVEPQGQVTGRRVVFMPFYDESGYRGPWDLGYSIPEMLGDMLGGTDDYFEVVPMDSVRAQMPKPPEENLIKKFFGLFRNKKKTQRVLTDSEVLAIARRLDGDIVITGLIDNFNMRRFKGVEPMVGGYGSYKTEVSIDQVRILRTSDGRPLGTVRGEESKTTRGLGLELFGKPRQMDLEFLSMDSLDFGSKRFLGTMWGQTTIEALNKVHKEIRAVITRPDSSWYLTKKFKVISIDAGNAIINAGSADGVNAGDRFSVFASESGVRVGQLSVITVWSDHVARCEILQGQDEIRPDDYLLPEI